MLYDVMRPWTYYHSQTLLPLPKKGEVQKPNSDESEVRAGYGNALFLMTPNIQASVDILSSGDRIGFTQGLYKAYTIDGRYNTKIGKKNIIKMEAGKLKSFYTDKKRIKLRYIPETSRRTIISTRKNIVVDLGRWMDLYFTYTIMSSPKVICERFAKFMAARLGDAQYDGYKKTLFIDICQWTSNGSGKQNCIVMNKRLLTNPLAILSYTIYHYPELLYPYKDVDLYLVSFMHEGSASCLKIPLGEVTKDSYSQWKNRISKFKEVTISADEENAEISTDEVLAEGAVAKKKRIYRELRKGLLGSSADITGDNPSYNDEVDAVFDITQEIEDIDTIDQEDEGTSSDDIEQEVFSVLNDYLDILPTDSTMSDQEIIEAVTPEIRKRIASAFMPERSPEEVAKIDRLKKGQEETIRPIDIKEAKSKQVSTTDMSSYVHSMNPNIKASKFVNFDNDYVEKKLNDHIDNAVASLSKADYPIFITGSEVIDSSNVMNIQQTRIYYLEDAKGNKMTLKFDVPVIIDGKYVFINGSKKIIGHQFVLKPLVKTSPDVVQLVTWYNKVFIYRKGQEDTATNKLRVYLQKNAAQYSVVAGASLMKNRKYETSLDFDTMSKFFYSFQIGNLQFITELDTLIAKYEQMNGMTQSTTPRTYDWTQEIPVAINMDTKTLVTIPTGSSYTKFILDCLPESEKAAVAKINRKPRLFSAQCKMKGHLFPIVFFMGFCVGLKELAKRAGMKYVIVDKDDKKELRKYDSLSWSVIEFEDKYLVWDNTDLSVGLLMNPLMREPMSLFTLDDMEDKDTWRYLLNRIDARMDVAMDNYKDFLIDPATEEILADFGYPTNLIDLLIVAVRLLADEKYKIESDMSNMRVRSAEVIPNIVYMWCTTAYQEYRKTAYKKKPTPVRFKQDAIKLTLLDGKTTNLLEEASSLNPVLELEKGRAITYKGLRGIQMDRALTLPRRGYNESMLGVCGISTSPKATIGA